ncbi:GNAT family N-acetyltransferase [Frigoriflavimonas asaccharolytica]|uniref:RimJ/RimL family protein N-acetyltransferase n=1 Tax=Frigoriflavimonas asaccharolytica TaxID=2735899 RepID=A0A8J8G7F1_9FLAO|nr:GNAT family N-acetyltransferase [Frigoriflavimonas asaccharolytica]NRS92060.1 RimJ/RimL family protein N-acetyltransferase [Frigoriflavimonas asaccharolytica]
MNFSLQEILENELVKIIPLEEIHFGKLFQLAKDEEVWSQHPNKNRFQRAIFQNFFIGAIESKGAFSIINKTTNQFIGSTRFYNFNEIENSIFIGYTFYGKEFWGKNYNAIVKKLMLDYIFKYVEVVNFHVGTENYRSQKAMKKLGAKNLGTLEIAYFGEESKLNILYKIKKVDWIESN